MIDRTVLEKMLKANGVEETASDEEIRSVLISAKWHDDDVNTAITVLRENTETHETRVDSLHKIFRSDNKLKPETVSSLLGIEMDLPAKQIIENPDAHRHYSTGQVLHIAIVSLALALVLVFGAMWMMKIGIFYTNGY